MPMESSTKEIDFSLFPHMVEVLDSFDDDSCTEITLQWAARLGKTFGVHVMIASTLANHPFPCIFGDANQDSVKMVFKRLWQTLGAVRELQDTLPSRQAQKNDLIETSVGTVYGAWAGSPQTAADKDARLVILNEADKMVPNSTRLEADFRLLLKKRAKNFTRPKIVQCSTPTVEGHSYIESMRLAGDNRRREVPCPHCGHFQELRTGDGKTKGGLRFERLKNGKLDPQKALETAWYECEVCPDKITEGHRLRMCQSGLWVPEGCSVRDGKIVGEPARRGGHHSFGPLSSLHGLVGTTLHTQAKRWVDALLNQHRSEAVRDYLNSEEGKTWSPAPSVQLMSALEQRMGEDRPIGIVPGWARFLTMGADVSKLGDDDYQFHWWVSAWGVGGRGCKVDLGTIYTRKAFKEWAKNQTWHCPERGGIFRPRIRLVDSGYFTQAMYEFCDGSGDLFIPIKGSNKDPEKPFSKDDSGEVMSKGAFRGEKVSWKKKLKETFQQFDLVLINTNLSQMWCEDRLSGEIGPEDPSWYSIPKDCFRPENIAKVDLPRHLVGDYRHDGAWLKRYEEQHYRDAWRYSRVAADIHTSNGTNWDNPADEIILAQNAAGPTNDGPSQGTSGLWGGAFLVTDRDYGEG